ncbi:hypothetical protein KAMFAM_175 [Bacillus phage Kamfam]|nr:hypothetical protein OTK52_173 [Bacillus phage OTooleKemple52]AXQ67189.1 hypothetical protein KAMFAM_175 [Bacillus phage Kamfam]
MTGTEALRDNITFYLNAERQAVQQIRRYMNMLSDKYDIEMPLKNISFIDDGNETPVPVEVAYIDYDNYLMEVSYTHPYSGIKTMTWVTLEAIAKFATLTEVQK